MSTKSDIIVFFENGGERTISFDKGTVLDIYQVQNETKALVRKSENHLLWTNFLEEDRRHEDFPYIPGVKQLITMQHAALTFSHQIVVANETSLCLLNDNDVTVLFEGKRILDVAFDICSNSILLINNKQVLISNLEQSNPKEKSPLPFTQLLPEENHAQLLASHSGRVILLTEKSDSLNADGFVIKDASSGQPICESDPSKAYNIRSMKLDNDQLFLIDALNYAVWQLHLKDTSSTICDLTAWTKTGSSQPPRKIMILHQSHTCISSQNDSSITNQREYTYEILSSSPASNVNNITERDDPCYNYCINGRCSTTALGVPICHCGQNFTGLRCENQPCFNYCLNQGRCNILEISLGTPSCTCPPGFDGKRCELQSEVRELEAAIDYFQGFLIMSGINVFFLLVIVTLGIGLIYQFRKQSKEKPQIVTATKKSSRRPRVFSGSSNSRSSSAVRNKSSRGNGNTNEAFTATVSNGTNKSSGHTCQALISDDGVVLDLEDCCQMTVCEKPCIEASFRKPTNRGSQKRTKALACHGDSHEDLLANVEFYWM